MIIKIKDFNKADEVISKNFVKEWNELNEVLKSLPLYLKSSEQRGKKGNLVFDPVGSNMFIKEELMKKNWISPIPIPSEYSCLGIDIDFGKVGILIEVQYSHYAFLLNNTLRSELFYKIKFEIDNKPLKLVIIITKSNMFPSANSSLYYEQAVEQLLAIANHSIFNVPIRLIGLFENNGNNISALWTKYLSNTSRKIKEQNEISVNIFNNKIKKSI